MSFHLFLGRLLLRAGAFIRSMAVVAMRPDDLLRFTADHYRRQAAVEEWGSAELVAAGLMDYEKSLVDRLPEKGGRLLLLGMGGGREAIPLAEMGFDVTGIDHAPALVARGLQLAADRGVKIEGLVQDISNLQLPSSRYDVVFFSRSMYSLVPSRKRRVHMLQRIREALKPEGSVLCQFHWDPSVFPGRKSLLIRRATACLTLGNFSYEPGDILWGGAEFVHAFGSEREVRSEFELAGFETSYWALFENWRCGGAILRLRDAERSRE